MTRYIPGEKAGLYLKLGRKLALFVKTDVFFEAQTFDWILIEKHGDQYRSSLVRTIHQGDEIFNDVLSFDTLNQDEPDFDEITNPFFIGSLTDCFNWMERNCKVKEFKFIDPAGLKEIYTELLRNGTLS